ncbi:MFS transporter [Caldivirga sp. UBA161]|uniref:MFS transporter n=1 Tax=Caldivirga sp. UBA161 TaxID=1915569 RepID=UPI0039C87D86
MEYNTSINPFNGINNISITSRHLKVLFTASMGFFTDAYDLFIIGAVLDIFRSMQINGFNPQMPILGIPAEGFIASSAILTAIIGQVLFGWLADYWGRRRVYGVEAALMATGALLSALAPNLYWLIAFRGILGLGIGGDYPVSSVIMSEYANVKDRGRLVALVFSSQGIGALTAVLVGLASVNLLPPSLAWRIMLAVGAIPALMVIHMRRKIPETPRYALLVKGDLREANKAAGFLGVRINEAASSRKLNMSEFLRRYWFTLIITAGTWFLMDIAYYGTGIYSGPIVTTFLPVSTYTALKSRIIHEVFEASLPFLVGLPGYFTAALLIDKVGRRLMQLQGFAIMGALYLTVSALVVINNAGLISFLAPTQVVLMLYVLTFFFINFGPNTTTFVVPAEVYPVSHRAMGHGISAAAGKAGAALSTLLLYPLLEAHVKELLVVYGIVSILGALLTIPLKETKNKDLESVSGEELVSRVSDIDRGIRLEAIARRLHG